MDGAGSTEHARGRFPAMRIQFEAMPDVAREASRDGTVTASAASAAARNSDCLNRPIPIAFGRLARP